ncbi:hypothetical protein [Neptunicella sp.]|uniref:hypothetical protein n=1 Tax=Neptunicella sp. TaxID=2125986 RepID=UPI003F6911A0
MKVQVKRFSTHQTAKVFAVLMAVTSLLFMIPFMLLSMFAGGDSGQFGVSVSMFIIMPFFQGVFGYIMVRFGMWIYNKITPRVGGIEFEFEEVES